MKESYGVTCMPLIGLHSTMYLEHPSQLTTVYSYVYEGGREGERERERESEYIVIIVYIYLTARVQIVAPPPPILKIMSMSL